MSLAIINGSPRGKKSNSKILIEHFLAGYRSQSNHENISVSYLIKSDQQKEHLASFSGSTNVILIFPLYTDCMPGMVKAFFEQIILLKEKPQNLGFIVQSGFPEAIHSVYVERYLQKLTLRLGCNYLGTVIKGGVEGIQVMPDSMTRKVFSKFRELGAHFAQHGEFSPAMVKQLKSPLRMSKLQQTGYRLVSLTGLTNFYWNSNLRKNGAWEKRFDKPYA